MPRDVTVTFADGSTHVYKGAPDTVTPEQVSARASQEFGKQVTALDGGRPPPVDLGQESVAVADQVVRGGITSLPRLLYSLESAGLKKLRNIGDPEETKPMSERSFTQLGGDVLRRMIPAEFPQLLDDAVALMEPTKPTTEVGKTIGNVGETIVGTMVGGGPLKQAAKVGLSAGIGGEVAARATDDNPLARLAGSVIGGGIPAVLERLIPNSEKLLRQAVSSVPAADWRRAAEMEKVLQDNGLSHLKSQLLGPQSTLADLMAVVSTHPQVRPGIMAAIGRAPEQAQRAFNVWKAGNMPVGIDSTRSVISDIQGRAAKRLTDLKRQANAEYSAALPPGVSADKYTPEEIRSVANTLRRVAADPEKYGPLSQGGRAIEGVAADIEGAVTPGLILTASGKPIEQGVSKGYLNNMLKDLNTRLEKEGYKGLALAELKDLLRQATPEFKPARDAKAAFMKDGVHPVEKGLTGDLARMGGGVKPDRTTATTRALEIVFPKDKVQTGEIRELADNLGKQGVAELLREHLSRTMEMTVKLSAEAGRPQQPFKYVEAIAGTNAQRQNLDTALKIAAEDAGANPAAVRNGFYKLMRAFESYKDLKVPASVDRAALQQMAGENAFGYLVAPNSKIGRWTWEHRTAKTFKTISDTVMSPDGLKKLEAMARSKDPEVFHNFITSVIAGTMSGMDNQSKP